MTRSLACGALLLGLALHAQRAHAQEADPWLGADKGLHFTASFVLGSGGYLAGVALFETRAPRVLSGAALALGGAVGKEALDLAGLGDPSWRDLAWDLVGAAVGVGLTWLIDTVVSASAGPQRTWIAGSPTNR